MSSIFGSNTATQTQNSAGTGLFGNSNTQNQAPAAGGSLFGSGTNPQTQGTSLFGNNQQSNQQSTTGGSLFGSAAPAQTQSNSLFGGGATQNQATGSSLFGSNTQNQPTNAGNSIFGTAPNANAGSSLFGGASTANTSANQQSSLFGQPAQTQSTSIFGSSTANRNMAQPTFAASTNTAPHQTHLSTLLQSGLGGHPASTFGALGSVSQQELARSRLANNNIAARPNEKSVIEQIQTLVRKWDPHSTDTLMQAYLYNAVQAAYAPFYHRNADEDEEGWEKALAKKPENISSEAGEVAFVPVLVRGFKALHDRLEYQAKTVTEMRLRLHEMNNSLDAVMRRHEQNMTLRIENARRQHAIISQRCLRLAVKAQVLRHKNYPLDAAEESLRKTLIDLEKNVFDPSIRAREEEIWARMMALRERSRWLEEEGKRLGIQVEEQKTNGNSAVSEEVLQKTKRILKDYDGQLRHLQLELNDIKGQYGEWEQSR